MFYCIDKCPYSKQHQELRLASALAITDAGIPCMVWAEDALAFIHLVPTALFCLQVIVPDDQLIAAATAVQATLPYFKTDTLPRRPLPFVTMSTYPQSIALAYSRPVDSLPDNTPQLVWIHPQSFFKLDIRDPSLAAAHPSTLPQRCSALRFPSRTAFMDTLLTALTHPPTGEINYGSLRSFSIWLAYIAQYYLRSENMCLEDGQLKPEAEALVWTVKEENRAVLNDYMGGPPRTSWVKEEETKSTVQSQTRYVFDVQPPMLMND
ncbi:hypothetical protein DENSPDRAFT_836858 [Dentipellis sp. KUC8613]|nr:hypothetical protein DENSPDRAFT_836858 [Dentipellis sp. KUC8613]